MNYLRKIDPFVFEELILTCYAERGFTIERNDRYTGDGGIDGKVMIDGMWHLIQAKRWRSFVAAVDVLRLAVLARKHGCRGLFVHTGRTGRLARKFAGSLVQIISGDELLMLVGGEP